VEETKRAGRPRVLDKPKKRFTLYLTEEAVQMFNELYAFRVMRGGNHTKSAVWCDAIKLLHRGEFKTLKGH
jgi:hypothetical protein